MRFITRWIESVVSRVIANKIDLAVARAESRLADHIDYDTFALSLNLDQLASRIDTTCLTSEVADCLDVPNLATLVSEKVVDAVAERVDADEVARHIKVADIAAAIDEDHLVDRLTDTVMDNIDQDKMQREIADNIAGDIDARDVARELDLSELAANLDYRDVAREVDYSSLKDELDMDELAGHLSGGDVADSLDLDKLAGKIDYRALAFALIEVASEQAARAKAQPTA